MPLDFKKYEGAVVKVTKLKDTRFDGKHPNNINEGDTRTGFVNVHESERLDALILDMGAKWFHTSAIDKILEEDGYDLIYTLNSVYKIEISMPSIPGVQQKYSLKLTSDNEDSIK